jgi:protein TonB
VTGIHDFINNSINGTVVTKYNFKWFLALSVAIHAAALVVWIDAVPDAGNPGQVLLLDVTDTTGQTASLPAMDPENRRSQTAAMARPPTPPHEPVYTTRRAGSEPAVETETDPVDTHRPDTPAPENMAASSATSLAASSPLPSREESDRHLRNRVLQLVTQRLSYPAIARRKGWQGIVTLELHIEADGLISSLHINETSGYPALDRAAVKALQLASIPGAGQWLHGRSIDMLIPVEYRLLDG